MKKALSLDIGGTNLRCALINENYEIENVIIKRTQTGSTEAFLEQVAQIIEEIGIDENVVGVGMGIPGQVRWDGYVRELPNVGIKNIPLAQFINERFNLTTTVLNDAQVAALGEGTIGAGKDYKSTCFITISTGIGVALCIDGKVFNPDDEMGHSTIKFEDQYYEFEKITSGNGLVNLCKLCGLEITTAREFFDLKMQNYAPAMKAYDIWINNLTNFFQYIKKYFEADIIVLSGGVTKSADVFLKDLQDKNPNIVIELAKFRQSAGLIGAAYCCFNYGSSY